MYTGKDLFLCPGEKNLNFTFQVAFFLCQGDKDWNFPLDYFISKFFFPIWEWPNPGLKRNRDGIVYVS